MAPVQLSAVIPLRGDHSDLEQTFTGYRRALDAWGGAYEMIWVVDHRRADLVHRLHQLRGDDPRVVLVGQSRWLGEAAAVAVGLRHGTGQIVLTLPEHCQVDPSGIQTALDALEGADVVVGRRAPFAAPARTRIQARLFHRLMQRAFGVALNDIGCRLRACRRTVLEESPVYGTQWRFLPLIAAQRGFRVREVEVAAGPNGNFARLRPFDYARRFLDVLSLFLLLKFTKRPLRFFGPLGFGVFGLGLLATGAVIASRLWLDVPLADRPALVMGVTMIVLGIQVVAVGLIGEIVIFAHGGQIKDQAVAEVVRAPAAAGAGT